MVRNVIASLLALVGATAAVWSPFRAWYDGRHGRDYRIADLFGGITGSQADLWTSLLLPFAFAALVTLVGLMLRSRGLIALAGLIVLGFTILWMVRQGQAAGGLSVESDGSGLGQGAGLAAGGGILLLLAAALMAGRRHVEREPHEAGGHGRLHGHRHGHGTGAPERHEEPYREPHEEPYREPHGEPYDDSGRHAYGQRPYAGDAPTAEYPRHDEGYGDRPGGPDPGPDEPGRGQDGPGHRPRWPRRGRD
ncbi:hypothetical protein [Streptomyces gobitricini]|uniref:Integral membrane protein n=1 Tax=Streptomyces gobitricini TaxID=68211 RepID=A0ABP5YPX0_9ACTN